MSRILSTILMTASIVFIVYRYRYRIINVLLGLSWIRRVAVGSMMRLPGVKQKLMGSVFGGPSEW
ncbi:hypothetical protein [Neobacillus dielmonensis]|uniref:hypothetical protein n=1 Tax=Neobacillus dielmonensis TaxID=1347369 RepID=UPI0005A64DAC|nr:hypothetical protein [Neobacillus dielmonensis]